MGLTWRDAVSSLALILVILAYAAYLQGAHVLLLSSAWATTAVILLLGMGCAVSATSDLFTRPQPRPGQIFRWVATVMGMIALIAGGIGLLIASAYALKILVMATIVVWGTATIWHAFTIGAESEPP